MRENDIQRMLEECLQGFDAGLTPDECLSAYPYAYAELEPLFRQALSLRIAYASVPGEAFRERAREKLMFAAGRDVQQVFAAQPDPDFVSQARRRVLYAAGAEAQEALRDVPPPRLPFWSNARRRLLETAAASPPRHASHALAFGMRSALSAAVITFAVAIAGLAFFVSSGPANDPQMAFAELEAIERSFLSLEQQWTEGSISPPGLLQEIQDLAVRTSTLYEHLDEESTTLERFSSLIDRQQEFIAYAESSGHDHPDLDSARTLLTETEEKLGDTVVLAEIEETIESGEGEEESPVETPSPTAESEPATPEPEEPTPEPTQEPDPTATVEPVDPIDPADLEPGEVLVQLDTADTTEDLAWNRISTSSASFVVPDGWTSALRPEQGLDTLLSEYLVFTPPSQQDGPTIAPIVVNLETGDVIALIDGEQVSLRWEGDVMDELELAERVGESAPALYHFLTSIEISSEEAEDTE